MVGTCDRTAFVRNTWADADSRRASCEEVGIRALDTRTRLPLRLRSTEVRRRKRRRRPGADERRSRIDRHRADSEAIPCPTTESAAPRHSAPAPGKLDEN